MTVHTVDLADCPSIPWRNGGGTTRELLMWPAGSTDSPSAGAHAWQLRVSVARIGHSGPFSPYPGVRRCFAVLLGDGVMLELPGENRTLTPADDAVAFDGEAAPLCHLLGGPTEDLNLMARRDAGTPQLQRAAVGSVLDGRHRWRGLFAVHGLNLLMGDRTLPLRAGSLAWTDDPDTPPWAVHDGGPGWWLSLE